IDDKLSFSDKIVKTAAGDRVAASVNNNRRLEEIDRRDAAVRCGFDRSGKGRRLGLVAEDGNQRGSVGDHRRKPRSSYSRSPLSTVRNGSLSRAAQSLPIATRRSARPTALPWRTRSRRSRTALVTAAVMLSPVSLASSRAKRCASSLLIFRLIGYTIL